MYLVIIGTHGRVIRRKFFADDAERLTSWLERGRRSLFIKEYHFSNAL